MFNKVVLVGNLTRDIELRYTTSGAAIGNTGIAVTRRFTANNEKREETCFVDISFFGKQAEIANQYLSKGSKVLVEGRLKFDQWTDNNGQNRSKHSISVENMEMLGGGSNQGGFNQNNQGGYGSNGGYSQQNSYGNQNNSQNYGNQNSYNSNNQQRVAQNQPNKQRNDDYYEEKIQEVDVNADKFDIDEDNIPF
ncbi:single-stranded DNA-binding protein [Campylobacter suis]|uniref:Single-stranded DNA-binding protein n=1 Tax=Campylobacter suis TaxID=2790657 RepID=A0ABM8Q369_9BACT|nr:single-stranded DNA-binding protein [Campylobacter suis]CAD7287199.1 Single-stranded DNA-binding protein [Campylobacter suis]